MRYRLILVLTVVLALADQAAKWLVTDSLAPHETITVTGFFNLVHVYNYGAAFGFLNDPSSSWQRWLFAGATLVAAAAVFAVARQADAGEKALFVALGCILGGAAGNLVDRLRIGAVVDFLDFHYAGWHWPAFNVADMAICAGAALMALCVIRQGRQGRQGR